MYLYFVVSNMLWMNHNLICIEFILYYEKQFDIYNIYKQINTIVKNL